MENNEPKKIKKYIRRYAKKSAPKLYDDEEVFACIKRIVSEFNKALEEVYVSKEVHCDYKKITLLDCIIYYDVEGNKIRFHKKNFKDIDYNEKVYITNYKDDVMISDERNKKTKIISYCQFDLYEVIHEILEYFLEEV